jgi:molecular chaperone GrpE
MTDDSHLTPEPEIPLETFEGLDNLSGPAAFKAKQKSAEEQVQLNVDKVLGDEIAKLQEALALSNDQLLRSVADMDNLRKRSVREREDASKYAITGFAKDLLDVADTFTRALQSIPVSLREDAKINNLIQGIESTEKSLLSAFEKNGIKKIEPLDEVFNPHFHEVMFEAPTAGKPSGIIIQIIEPGYVINERLLRPARVGVSKAIDGDTTLRVVDTEA